MSEVTTSNNAQSTTTIQQHFPLLHRHHSHSGVDKEQPAHLLPIVKIEHRSPPDPATFAPIAPIAMDHSGAGQMQAAAIPVGIAVARQRLQEHAQIQPAQTKEMARFGSIGIANDLGE